VLVHCCVIQGEGYRSLSEGQLVEFVASESDKGWLASEVSPVA
jgi:cold shock CspA family protein